MRVALINGSPKLKNSTSEVLLGDLKKYLNEGKCSAEEENVEIVNFEFHSCIISEKDMEELVKTDAWIFAFPLYIDSTPGHLLSCLIELEQACIRNSRIHIYGIVNCGFYEGTHAELALKLLQNWCMKADFVWGGGIGVGGGGAVARMPKRSGGHDPRAKIDKALEELSKRIIEGERGENDYVTVAIPRFLYQWMGQMRWRQLIKANGKKAEIWVKDLNGRKCQRRNYETLSL